MGLFCIKKSEANRVAVQRIYLFMLRHFHGQVNGNHNFTESTKIVHVLQKKRKKRAKCSMSSSQIRWGTEATLDIIFLIFQ